MEARRIEGITLQTLLEQQQSLRAQKAYELLKVKALQTTPEVYTELAGREGNLIRARVSHAEGSTVELLIGERTRLIAENMSSYRLEEGDLVELVVESTNPLTLKVVSLQRFLSLERVFELLFSQKAEFYLPLDENRLAQSLKGSGLFYERELLNLALGKTRPEELMQDKKAQLLRDLMPLVKEFSKLLALEYENTLEGYRELYAKVKESAEKLQRLLEAFKTLTLENLSHKDYANTVRVLYEKGYGPALERRDHPTIIKALVENLEHLSPQVLQKVKEALRSLELLSEDKGDVGKLSQELLRAIKEGKQEDIKKAYTLASSFLADSERLLQAYQQKGEVFGALLGRLEFIHQLQQNLAKLRDAFYVPVYFEGGRGGLVFAKKEGYKVFISLNWGQDFVFCLLNMPQKGKYVDLRLFSNMEPFVRWAKAEEKTIRGMLSEEGLELRNYHVNLGKKEELKEELIKTFAGEGFFMVV